MVGLHAIEVIVMYIIDFAESIYYVCSIKLSPVFTSHSCVQINFTSIYVHVEQK